MDEMLRRLRAIITSVVSLAIVDRSESSQRYQVLYGAERAASGVEHLEPQGVHFGVPADAQGVLLSPQGVRDAAVLVGAGGAQPSDALASGTGGLHYLGEWRVYIADDGTVHLGQKDPTDWVALASLVDARLSAIVNWLNTHTHPTAPTGPVSVPSTPIGAQASVASTTLKAE